MEPIPPEVARKLLNRDFSNLIQRVQGGGKLTRSERNMLQAMAAGSVASGITLAANYNELAEALGVTRQAIHAWRKLEGAPEANANGTHEVAVWREFVKQRGLKNEEDVSDAESSLKARKLLAEVMEREFRLQVKQGEYVLLDDVKTRWAYHVGQAVALLRKRLEQEIPPILSGLDAIAIRKAFSTPTGMASAICRASLASSTISARLAAMRSGSTRVSSRPLAMPAMTSAISTMSRRVTAPMPT